MLNPENTDLGRLRAKPGAHPTPDCPLEHELLAVAQHEAVAEREKELLEHCAECDFCAARLKNAFSLAEPLTLEQEDLIDRLPSSGNAKELAAKLTKRFTVRPWMALAAAVLVVGTTVPLVYSSWQKRQNDRQIAEQYAKLRPIEFRLEGLPYGPYRQLLGASQVAASGQDSWRAALLEQDLDGAVKRIDDKLRSDGRTPELLNDLAAVHAAIGDRLRSDNEYEEALRLLNEALAQSPRSRPALFNKMLVLDRLHRREESLRVASALEKIETDSGWRAEVRAIAGN